MEQYFLGDTVPRRPCLQPDTGEALAKERNGETTRSQLWLLRLGPWNHTHFCWCWAPMQIPSNSIKLHFWILLGCFWIHPSSFGFHRGSGFPFYPLTVQQPRSFGLPHHLPHRFCLRTMTRLNRTLHFPSQEIARCYVTLLLAWNMFFSQHSLPAEPVLVPSSQPIQADQHA